MLWWREIIAAFRRLRAPARTFLSYSHTNPWRATMLLPHFTWLPMLLLAAAETSAVPQRSTIAQWLSERASRAAGAARTTSTRSSTSRLSTVSSNVARGGPRAPRPTNESLVYRLAADYGADPTGHTDSSDAIERALADMWSQAPLQAPGGPWMDPEGGQLNGPDLGGEVLDLEGGTYGVSRPVRFPALAGGNMWLRGGTLRARPGFSFDCTTCSLVSIVELVATNASTAYGYINFFALTIDANGATSGALKIVTRCVNYSRCTDTERRID
eukprot:SAG11_NODE_8560_length_1000_cov_1.857936_1_plen_271_part_00